MEQKIKMAAGIVAAAFWLWVLASWANVIGQNMTPCDTTAAWNLFSIVF